MFHRTILCVSSDQAQNDDNSWVLTQAGYSVLATTLVREALDLFACERVDLVIVSDELSSREKEQLVSCARDKFGIPVVLVSPPPKVNSAGEVDSTKGNTTEGDLSADRYVDTLASAEGLLNTVMELLPTHRAAASGR